VVGGGLGSDSRGHEEDVEGAISRRLETERKEI